MKKLHVTVVITLLLGLLFSAVTVFASPAVPEKPRQTPGAQATAKAVERATQGHGGPDNGHPAANATHGPDSTHGPNNAHGPSNTPGAKATEKAEAAATHAAGGHHGERVTFRGVVSAAGGGSLTLALSGGGSQTFLITSATRIQIPTLGRHATLADVNVGVSALVQVLQADSSYSALFVSVVPGRPEPVHRVGIVTAYIPGASITVMDKDGQSSTFLLTPETKILPAERANELAVGARVTIISRRDPTGGPLTAQGIVIHPNTAEPTATATGPTATPSDTPTATETATAMDTATATDTPTNTPTAMDTATATDTPTNTPTAMDTATATDTPTNTPSATDTPTATPTSTTSP